jgi:hypothetical protein
LGLDFFDYKAQLQIQFRAAGEVQKRGKVDNSAIALTRRSLRFPQRWMGLVDQFGVRGETRAE